MKNRKRLFFGIALIVVAAGSLTTWLIVRANTQTQSVKTEYLQAFFQRYVAALNSQNVADTQAFYSPDAVTVGAWGIEMSNEERLAYFAACREAFPDAQFIVRNVKIEPTSEMSGTITWEFGIKAGRQVAPFLGVYNRVAAEKGEFDQEGISIMECEQITRPSVEEMKSIDRQILTLDKEIRFLNKQIAALDITISSKNPRLQQQEKIILDEKKTGLEGRRALLQQVKIDRIVASIKFTRQTSYQNMDRFLKKIGGK